MGAADSRRRPEQATCAAVASSQAALWGAAPRQPKEAPDRRAAAAPPRQRSRLLRCVDHRWGLSRGTEAADTESAPNPLALRLAAQKGLEVSRSRGYQALLAEALSSVAAAVAQQIRLDVCRSFASLPQPQAGVWSWPRSTSPGVQEQQPEVLFRMLVAFEWRASGLTSAASTSGEAPSAYVQGCSLLAAMCVGFVGGREEEAFWLLLHLLEDVLGEGFLSKSPPLLGYHGDCAAAAALAAGEAPRLLQELGPRRLQELTSVLASRCLLSCFVGFLADGPLLALWAELLEGHTRCATFPRFSLLHWLVGLVCHFEADLIIAAQCSQPEELVPILFKAVQKAARALPEAWRPTAQGFSKEQVLRARQVSELTAQGHLRSHQERARRAPRAERPMGQVDEPAVQLEGAAQPLDVQPTWGGA